VLGLELARQVARLPRALARERCHEDAIRAAEPAKVDGVEERRHGWEG
jgi:hypothetical protein